MSYARWGQEGSDVYVFLSRDGLECCGCLLQETEWVDEPDDMFGGYLRAVGEKIQTTFTSTMEMVAHLYRHIDAGHTVPVGTLVAIVNDDAENFGGTKS